MKANKRSAWLEYILIFLLPVLGMALGFGITFLLGINQSDYSNLTINIFFLIAGVLLMRIFKFSKEDVGLKVLPTQMKMHVLLSLGIFVLYLLFYIFVIHISALKPFSVAMFWSLLNYLFVVLAEELYFRGVLYAFIQKRFSERAALIVSSIVFGLFHASQGLRGILLKTVTGWLWGSVRYSTGMIYLLIIPVHFAYNTVWLLFEGNWGNPPAWAIYVFPAMEFVMGLMIVVIRNRQPKNA